MARFGRVAIFAVLAVALFVGARPSIAGSEPLSTAIARLQPSRVFNPDSESLFAAVATQPHGMSLLAGALFNVESQVEAAMIGDLPEKEEPAIGGVASVNLPAVDHVRGFTPAPAHAFAAIPPLAAKAAKIETPAPSSFYGDEPDQGGAQIAPVPASTPQVASAPVGPVHFGSYRPYTPSISGASADVSVPVRVGRVRFSGEMAGSEAETMHTDAVRAMQLCGTTDEASACPYLHDSSAQSFVAGTDFNVRAGSKDLKLQLSTSVEHVSNDDAGIFPYVPMDPDMQLGAPAFNAATDDGLTYPGLTDVVKHGVNARLAVPVSPRLTIGLQYDRAHYQGDYTSTVLQGLDARKDTYQGNVTYQLPKINSAITLSARQYRYQDTLSNFNLTQTRADLDFTVKF